VDLPKILLHLLGFRKNVAETCFCQGRNLFLPRQFKPQFKPLMAETCQPWFASNTHIPPYGAQFRLPTEPRRKFFPRCHLYIGFWESRP